MKNTTKIFALVVVLLLVSVVLAWLGVRHLAEVVREFDHVAQEDLVLMEGATGLNVFQLQKEILFNKLSSSAEEMAFGHPNASRGQYLQDYVHGLGEQFDKYVELSDQQMQQIENLPYIPSGLKLSFENMSDQSHRYDGTVQAVFKAVEKGGFQLSLEDLERTDFQQRVLSDSVQNIVFQVWGLVHESVDKSRRWHRQSKMIFGFSLLLTAILGFLLYIFKQNLDEINRQKKDLEKLNQELDRFVHTVSHDIAGPLTTIVGYAAHLELHYAKQLDQRGQDAIKGVRKGATRLTVLIKDMLELTKMTRVKNPYARFAVQESVDAALANCEFMLRQSSAVVEIEKKLPEITGDRVKITAVFFNLIANALKFAKPHVRPLIKISWSETTREYIFYVADNGIGIEPAHHKDIFEIFTKVYSEDKYSGSGVGLTIVRAGVEDHGGTVKVESVPGQGATFIFTVPKSLPASKPSPFL